jgi:hypothetical protein
VFVKLHLVIYDAGFVW